MGSFPLSQLLPILLIFGFIVLIVLGRRNKKPLLRKESKEYDAEWREKYLRARIVYLKKKIVKKSGIPVNSVIPSFDTKAKLNALQDWADALEAQLKSLQ